MTGSQIFIQNTLPFLYSRFPFKGEEDRSLRMKRRVAEGAVVFAVSSSPPKLISGFFFYKITTSKELRGIFRIFRRLIFFLSTPTRIFRKSTLPPLHLFRYSMLSSSVAVLQQRR